MQSGQIQAKRPCLLDVGGVVSLTVLDPQNGQGISSGFVVLSFAAIAVLSHCFG
jgi:hypothetical protein